jgi:polar amino acid transport system permease protein
VSFLGNRAKAQGGDRSGEFQAIPVRHPGRWIAAAIVLFLGFMLAESLASNPRLHWDVVGHYLFDSTILSGLVMTLELTGCAMAIAVVVGILLAVMRLSPNRVLSSASWLYLWIFRGTPLLVQILIWYFLAAVFPKLGLGIPYGPTFVHFDANKIIGQMSAAVLALGLNEAAYMAENVRAGILSVPAGQSEAAQSLGMSRGRTMRRVVLPQAMRVIIPPLGNATILMLKTTSLVLIIALPDLLTSAQIIYSRNFLQIPLLIVASIWYLVVTTCLTIIQYYVERYFGRGSARERPPGALEWLRTSFRRTSAPPPAADRPATVEGGAP